jgi:ankyrin repeat protein
LELGKPVLVIGCLPPSPLLIISAQKIHRLVPILPHKAVVELLLKKSANLESKDDDSSETPLLSAATYRFEAIVKLLLEKGAQLEFKDNYGQTPLLYVAERGHEVVAKLLLEKGANLESKDNNSQTPL